MASTFGALTDLLQLFGEQAAGRYLGSRSMLGTIIRVGLEGNMTATDILKAYRLNGGTVANSTFWGLKGQIQSAENKFASAANLLAGQSPAVQQIGGGKAGSYRVQMRAYYQKMGDNGEMERGYQQFTLHQRELDVERALEDAGNIWSDNTDTDSLPGQLLGLELTGIYQYTGQ
jgi:hypothetical protein